VPTAILSEHPSPKTANKKTQLHEAVAVRVDDGFGFFLDLQLIRFLINPEC
jgi:hypothetical protein